MCTPYGGWRPLTSKPTVSVYMSAELVVAWTWGFCSMAAIHCCQRVLDGTSVHCWSGARMRERRMAKGAKWTSTRHMSGPRK